MSRVWDETWDEIGTPAGVYTSYKASHGIIGGKFSEPLIEAKGLASVTLPKMEHLLQMDRSHYFPDAEGNAHLCDAQVEAIIYANQAFKNQFAVNRVPYQQGFYLADGIGLGKCRTLAGIAHEYMLNDRKNQKRVLWFTGSAKSFTDIFGECKSFDTAVEVMDVERYFMARQFNMGHAILVITYDDYSECEQKQELIKQFVQSCQSPLILFDDAHFMRTGENGTKPSKRGKDAVELQRDFPQARVVYSSGVGASEIEHMLPFSRLGIWGDDKPFKTKKEFKKQLSKMGMCAVELVPMQLKMNGVFVSRQLSNESVEQTVVDVEANADFEILYERCSQLVTLLAKYVIRICEERIQEGNGQENQTLRQSLWKMCTDFFQHLVISSKIGSAIEIVRDAKRRGECSVVGIQHTYQSQFKRFEREKKWTKGHPFSALAYILRTSMLKWEIPIGCPKTFVRDQRNAVKIGSWSTDDENKADKYGSKPVENGDENEEGEDNHSDQPPPAKRARISDEFSVGSLTNDVFTTVVNWPVNSVGYYIKEKNSLFSPANKITWSYEKVKDNPTPSGLARLYHELFPFLPISPLDILVSVENEEPENRAKPIRVLDLTGRDKVYAYSSKQKVWDVVVKRKLILDTRDDEFTTGEGPNEVDLVIISESSSNGISLHASKRFKNQRRRNHITLEYGWSPVNILQQLGRTHRGNQVCGPHYYSIKSQIPGDQRSTSLIAKRIKQLSALQQGNADASERVTSLLSDHLYTCEGAAAIRFALEKLNTQCRIHNPMTSRQLKTLEISKANYDVNRIHDRLYHAVESELNKILNRVLILPIAKQRIFFRYVEEYMEGSGYKSIRQASTPLKEIMFNEAMGFGLVKEMKSDRLDGRKILCFEIDRVSDYPLLNTNWVMYTKDGDKFNEVASVSKNIADGCRAAIFPFCKYEVRVPNDGFEGWVESQGTNPKPREYWRQALSKFNKYPEACIEKRESRRGRACERNFPSKRKCMHQWGKQSFFIVTKPTFELIKYLKEKKVFLQLAQVKFRDRDETGIFIGNENCPCVNLKYFMGAHCKQLLKN